MIARGRRLRAADRAGQRTTAKAWRRRSPPPPTVCRHAGRNHLAHGTGCHPFAAAERRLLLGEAEAAIRQEQGVEKGPPRPCPRQPSPPGLGSAIAVVVQDRPHGGEHAQSGEAPHRLRPPPPPRLQRRHRRSRCRARWFCPRRRCAARKLPVRGSTQQRSPLPRRAADWAPHPDAGARGRRARRLCSKRR